MEQFPHLKFVQKIEGEPRIFGGGGTSVISQYNKDNRQNHSQNLINEATN